MEERKDRLPGCARFLLVLLAVLAVSWCIRGCVKARERRLREEELRRYREEAVASVTAVPKETGPAPTAIRPEALDIPVVGMKEEDINKTKHPWKLRETTRSVWPGHEYVNYSDRHDGVVTLSLKCFNGTVVEVNDYRRDPEKVSNYGLGRDPHTATRKPSDEYGSPEEFYDEHREEFGDFDEAEEEYWEDYRGG